MARDPSQLQLLSLLSDTKCFGERQKDLKTGMLFSTLRFYTELDFGFLSVQAWRQSKAAEPRCSCRTALPPASA